MRKPGKKNFAILLPLALALAACGGDAPDDDQATTPAPAAGDAAPPASAPEGAMPDLPTNEQGVPEPWAVAAHMGAGIAALAEECGMADTGRFDSLDADARNEIEAMGADMQAFEAMWDEAYAYTRSEFAAGTDAQRTEACAEMEQMSEQLGAGADVP